MMVSLYLGPNVVLEEAYWSMAWIALKIGFDIHLDQSL